MALTVHPEFEKIVADFDARTTTFEPMDLHSAFAVAMQAFGELDTAGKRGAYADWSAFNFMASFRSESPWGTYYGPMTTFQTPDKTFLYQPDLGEVNDETVAHWADRAATLTNPVLKARYADLAWDFGPKVADAKVRRDTAIIAIDAYADIVLIPERGVVQAIHDAIRALQLAVQIKDAARIETARANLLALHQRLFAAGDCRMEPYDALISTRCGLNPAEHDGLVADLEALFARFADTGGAYFEPHSTEYVAERLLKHHTKGGRKADVKRVHLAVARAFEHVAQMGSALVASGFLQTSMDAYKKAGERSEAERVRRLMATKVQESQAEMTEHRAEITVTDAERDAFLAQILADDWFETLMNIGGQLMLRRGQLEQQVAEQAEKTPLMAMIRQSLIDGDRVVATVGSVEDDPFGRVIQHANFMLDFSTPWLAWAVEAAIARHGLTADHIIAFANRAGLFGDGALLAEGVNAWFAKDYVKAVHVLIPQVEGALRNLAGLKGQPTTKSSTKYGSAQMAVTMGDILYSADYVAALGKAGPDLAVHFATLYADPRGKNLRNELAHGLLAAANCSEGVMLWVIHSLLLLGGWAAPARPAPPTEEA